MEKRFKLFTIILIIYLCFTSTFAIDYSNVSFSEFNEMQFKLRCLVIIRNTDGNGNAFDADRYIYKDDGKTKEIVYHDKVGANCFEGYENEDCFTEPDGEYYYTFSGCKANPDGTYDTPSGKFQNVIRHQTDDPNIPESIRDKINNNPGDFYDHANVVNGIIYGNNERALSAGCTIGKNGQEQQDAYMKALMDGLSDPTTIRKVIHSYSNGDR